MLLQFPKSLVGDFYLPSQRHVKHKILVILTFLFALSQVSGPFVSLQSNDKALKDSISLLLENEENEEAETEDAGQELWYCQLSGHFVSVNYLEITISYLVSDVSILNSYTPKPETPPPNFC